MSDNKILKIIGVIVTLLILSLGIYFVYNNFISKNNAKENNNGTDKNNEEISLFLAEEIYLMVNLDYTDAFNFYNVEGTVYAKDLKDSEKLYIAYKQIEPNLFSKEQCPKNFVAEINSTQNNSANNLWRCLNINDGNPKKQAEFVSMIPSTVMKSTLEKIFGPNVSYKKENNFNRDYSNSQTWFFYNNFDAYVLLGFPADIALNEGIGSTVTHAEKVNNYIHIYVTITKSDNTDIGDDNRESKNFKFSFTISENNYYFYSVTKL